VGERNRLALVALATGTLVALMGCAEDPRICQTQTCHTAPDGVLVTEDDTPVTDEGRAHRAYVEELEENDRKEAKRRADEQRALQEKQAAELAENDRKEAQRRADEQRALLEKQAAEAARERQFGADRLADQSGKRNTETVFSRGDGGAVPGTIICPDYRTVEILISWYKTNRPNRLLREDVAPESLLMNWPSTSEPNFKGSGCALLAPGTPMILERGNTVPVVSATLPDGTTIRGVTDQSMIGR
jgi:hypothetical protein